MLTGFFAPRSIAVVGASRDPGKVGHAVFANLVAGGYPGRLHPINPAASEVLGHAAYPALADIPEQVDLAVVVVPASACVAIIAECAALRIRSAIVISAGFRETGPSGAALERELMRTAREGGVRILGPNCLGLIATNARINASFAPLMPPTGSISFLSQSGALGTAVLDWAAGAGVGLAHFVSLGNKADVSEIDLIEAWTEDPHTAVVVAYLEAITEGRDFVAAVRRLVDRAPFIALTAGSSDAGARAVSSHTGSLAGTRSAYEAAFRKAGATAAHTVQELFDFADGFARQPLPDGPGTVILTNAGGPGILATDACEEHGLLLATLEPGTTASLREVLPSAAAVYNPVDILGDASADLYDQALDIVLRDPNCHSLIVILTPQAMTQPIETARRVVARSHEAGVTTMGVFMGAASVAEAVGVLAAGGVPAYAYPERAVGTLAAMERHRAFRDAPPSEPCDVSIDRATVRAAVDHAQQAHRTFITDPSAQRIAQACGVRTPKTGVAADLSGAISLAEEIGYPVVLKISSPDILHKSDIGGIMLDLTDSESVASAYDAIISRVARRMPEARIWGVTVQEQVPRGREVIIGVNRDPRFGPILMFGLGGIYVEVLKDVTFRLCPVLPDEARQMITEIRSVALLRGSRGAPPADTDAIVDVICKVSALATEFDDITELDINPLVVLDRGHGAVAADIRIGIGG
ncbi:MAG: acetate--CoA ligase family protein [Coriobacteriia bacterium]